jgi:hypothetical protein
VGKDFGRRDLNVHSLQIKYTVAKVLNSTYITLQRDKLL